MVQQLGSKQGLKGIWPTLFAGSKPEDSVDYEPYNSFLNFVEKEASNPKKVSAKLNPLTKHKKYLEVSDSYKSNLYPCLLYTSDAADE